MGEASVGVLELWGGLSPAPHFSPGFGGGVQTQKPGEPQPHLCLCPLPGVCGPFPPSPSPPSVPPGFGNGIGLGAQPGESGGVWRLPHAYVLSRLLSRPHEGWGMIEGCWEETPRIPAFWLGFRLSQTPNPPSSPFLSPQAQQHRRDMEQVHASTSTGAIPSYPKLYLSCEISSGLLIILPQDSKMD